LLKLTSNWNECKPLSMGTETVPAGFVENDLIYWLRYM